MKAFLTFLLSVLFLVACSDDETDLVKSFIPGSYAGNTFQVINEGTKVRGVDTFHITQPAGNEIFEVERRTLIMRTLDGQPQPVVQKVSKWTAKFDPVTKTLVVDDTGEVLTFNVNAKELRFDRIVLKKFQ